MELLVELRQLRKFFLGGCGPGGPEDDQQRLPAVLRGIDRVALKRWTLHEQFLAGQVHAAQSASGLLTRRGRREVLDELGVIRTSLIFLGVELVRAGPL